MSKCFICQQNETLLKASTSQLIRLKDIVDRYNSNKSSLSILKEYQELQEEILNENDVK